MEKALEMARELASLMENSQEYREYRDSLAVVKADPALLAKIKEYKQYQHAFASKLMQGLPPQIDEEKHVSLLYANLMLNQQANLFLRREKKLLEDVSAIQSLVGECCRVELEWYS